MYKTGIYEITFTHFWLWKEYFTPKGNYVLICSALCHAKLYSFQGLMTLPGIILVYLQYIEKNSLTHCIFILEFFFHGIQIYSWSEAGERGSGLSSLWGQCCFYEVSEMTYFSTLERRTLTHDGHSCMFLFRALSTASTQRNNQMLVQNPLL